MDPDHILQNEADPRETIWLASYPRSGNTFLRIILKEVFGLRSDSIYKKASSGSKWPSAARLDLENHVPDLSRPRLVKTHGVPSDSAKAIYIVRDGRSAIASYFHYLNDIEETATPIDEIIAGNVWAGSWSDHVAAWSPAKRPHTLLVRYEDLRFHLDDVLVALGEFLGLPLVGSADAADIFRNMNAVHPAFFRAGNDLTGVREMRPHADLFNRHHAPRMLELGYFASNEDIDRWRRRDPTTLENEALLKRLHDAATPGPWDLYPSGPGQRGLRSLKTSTVVAPHVCSHADQAFIGAIHRELPRLLDRIECLQGQIEELKGTRVAELESPAGPSD